MKRSATWLSLIPILFTACGEDTDRKAHAAHHHTQGSEKTNSSTDVGLAPSAQKAELATQIRARYAAMSSDDLRALEKYFDVSSEEVEYAIKTDPTGLPAVALATVLVGAVGALAGIVVTNDYNERTRAENARDMQRELEGRWSHSQISDNSTVFDPSWDLTESN